MPGRVVKHVFIRENAEFCGEKDGLGLHVTFAFAVQPCPPGVHPSCVITEKRLLFPEALHSFLPWLLGSSEPHVCPVVAASSSPLAGQFALSLFPLLPFFFFHLFIILRCLKLAEISSGKRQAISKEMIKAEVRPGRWPGPVSRALVWVEGF